jgi:gamma-glutamyltranspeptidase / glutathione hydrolase / leukotriene-C4 hydrolase
MSFPCSFNLFQKKLFIFALLGAIVVVAVTLGLYFGLKSPAKNLRYGGVASNGYECAEIGANVLKQQGTAVDAAIAVLFCENVAVPQSMGLGGGFLMTVYDKEKQQVDTLIAREVAPMHATADMFVGNNQAAAIGGLAVAVPGELKGYWEAHQKYGKLPWRQLIEPSIELCKRGSVVNPKLAAVLESLEARILAEPSLREVFINPNTSKVWLEGELIPRPKLAETMAIIARDGVDALYTKGGVLLQPLVDDIAAFGGIITEEDFLNYTVRWESPIQMKLIDDMTLYTIPLPGSGIVLSYILRVLSHFQLDHSGLSWHRMIEAFKFAYAKRTNLGDPAFVDGIEAIVADMTSSEHIQEVWSRIDDTKTFNDYAHYGANFSVVEDRGTAHIAIISPNGDAVSVTSTIND